MSVFRIGDRTLLRGERGVRDSESPSKRAARGVRVAYRAVDGRGMLRAGNRAVLQEELTRAQVDLRAAHDHLQSGDRSSSGAPGEKAGDEEVAVWRARVADLEARVASMQGIVQDKAELESRVGALTQEKAELEARVGALGQDKVELESRVGVLGQDKAELESRVGALGQDKAELEARVGALDGQVVSLQEAASALESAIAERDGELGRLREALVGWESGERGRAEREGLGREVEEALRERETAARERDAALQERDAALRERDAAVGERDAAVQERDAAVQERDAAIQERNAASGAKAGGDVGESGVAVDAPPAPSVLSSPAEAGLDGRDARPDADQLAAEVEELHASLAEVREMLQRAEETVEGLEAEVEQARVREEEATARAARVEGEVAELWSAREGLDARVTAAEQERDAALADAEQAQERAAVAEQDRDEALVELTGARERAAAAEGRARDAEGAAEEAGAATGELRAVVNKLEATVRSLERELSETVTQCDNLRERAEALSREREEALEARRRAEGERDELVERMVGIARERDEAVEGREVAAAEVRESQARAEGLGRERDELAAALREVTQAQDVVSRERVELVAVRDELVRELQAVTAELERVRAAGDRGGDGGATVHDAASSQEVGSSQPGEPVGVPGPSRVRVTITVDGSEGSRAAGTAGDALEGPAQESCVRVLASELERVQGERDALRRELEELRSRGSGERGGEARHEDAGAGAAVAQSHGLESLRREGEEVEGPLGPGNFRPRQSSAVSLSGSHSGAPVAPRSSIDGPTAEGASVGVSRAAAEEASRARAELEARMERLAADSAQKDRHLRNLVDQLAEAQAAMERATGERDRERARWREERGAIVAERDRMVRDLRAEVEAARASKQGVDAMVRGTAEALAKEKELRTKAEATVAERDREVRRRWG